MNWRRLFDPVEWEMFLHPLTHEQREMIKELEKLSDHVETVRKAGIDDEGTFPLLFFERDGETRAATVHRDGYVGWGDWKEGNNGN